MYTLARFGVKSLGTSPLYHQRAFAASCDGLSSGGSKHLICIVLWRISPIIWEFLTIFLYNPQFSGIILENPGPSNELC